MDRSRYIYIYIYIHLNLYAILLFIIIKKILKTRGHTTWEPGGMVTSVTAHFLNSNNRAHHENKALITFEIRTSYDLMFYLCLS